MLRSLFNLHGGSFIFNNRRESEPTADGIRPNNSRTLTLFYMNMPKSEDNKLFCAQKLLFLSLL